MGEDHLGVLLSLGVHGVEVVEGDTEDDITALTHQVVHSGGHLVVLLGHLVHDDQLAVRVQAQLVHGGGDALVVGVGVTGGVGLLVDIDGTDLKVAVGSAGVGALGVAVSAAGGQAQRHDASHHQGKDTLFHTFSSSFKYPLSDSYYYFQKGAAF